MFDNRFIQLISRLCHLSSVSELTKAVLKNISGLCRTCRGLATWVDPRKQDGAPCRRYVYMGTLAARLVAVDAATGEFCTEFGDGVGQNH